MREWMKPLGVAAASLAALALAACGPAAKAPAATAGGTLNIYNWSDYIDPALLKEFTAQTGIKVRYDTSTPSRRC